MPIVAKLAVQAATYAIDKAYDYLLPDELLREVPVLELSCDMSEEAVRVSYEALSKL